MNPDGWSDRKFYGYLLLVLAVCAVLFYALAAQAAESYPTEAPGACIVWSCPKDSKISTGDACFCVTWARSRPPMKRRPQEGK